METLAWEKDDKILIRKLKELKLYIYVYIYIQSEREIQSKK